MASHNALGIRVIELPACKMAVTAGAALPEFDRWWSGLDRQRTDKLYPRDFIYHDAQMNQLVGPMHCPRRMGNRARTHCSISWGGFYAVAVSLDQNDVDGERVYQGIKAWIEASDALAVDESRDRPTLLHVITSDRAHAKLNYRHLDIYVPI